MKHAPHQSRRALPAAVIALALFACSQATPADVPPSGTSPARGESEEYQAAVADCRSVLRDAASLLEAGKFREMIESTVRPDKVDELKRTGRLAMVVERFERGWGRTLLAKIRDAATDRKPKWRDDGAMEFDVPYPLGPMSQAIVLSKVGDRWFVVE